MNHMGWVVADGGEPETQGPHLEDVPSLQQLSSTMCWISTDQWDSGTPRQSS